MVALGLLILVAAGVVGAAGVLGNDGSAHNVSPAFEVLGVEFTGSTGVLFLIGMLVGVAGTIGIGLMLVGSKRRARHRLENRRERRDIRGEAETLQQERDRLAQELADEREQRTVEPIVAAEGPPSAWATSPSEETTTPNEATPRAGVGLSANEDTAYRRPPKS